MKLHLVACASLFVCTALARSQAQLDWVALRNGTPGLDDYGWKCAADASGNVYALGDSAAPLPAGQSGTQFDAMLTKFSPTGAVVWSRRFDLFGYDDLMRALAISPSGDVYFTGVSLDGVAGGPSTITHLVLAKYSSAGVQQWVRRYHVQGIDSIIGKAMAFDANGNVIVAGSRNFATQLLSYAPDGTLQWEQHIGGGGAGGSSLIDVVVTPQNEILACGTRAGDGHQNFAVYKYLADGTYQWTAIPDLANNYQGTALRIALAGPGKVVAGGSRWIPSNTDGALAQIDVATGNVDWSLYYDGGFGTDEVDAVATDASGVVWAVLRSMSASSDFDAVTLRASSAGQILSTATWSEGPGFSDYPQSLLLGSAGQAWITCSPHGLSNDIAVVQYDSQGVYDWQQVFSVTPSSYEVCPIASTALAPNDRIAVVGSSNGGTSGNYDVMVVQFDASHSPSGYCTAKVNSIGCTPHIAFTGQSSVAATSGFAIRCDDVRNQKSGLLFYGVNGAASSPFHGGYLCVAAPLHRTAVANSGGSALGDDCSGAYSLDMNAFASGALGGAPAPELSIAGTDVFCQQWSRDPGAASNIGLSSGLRYTVLP